MFQIFILYVIVGIITSVVQDSSDDVLAPKIHAKRENNLLYSLQVSFVRLVTWPYQIIKMFYIVSKLTAKEAKKQIEEEKVKLTPKAPEKTEEEKELDKKVEEELEGF